MRSRRIRGFMAIAALTSMLVGCGSEQAGPDEPTEATTQEHGSFAHCLQEHGVEESAVSPAGPPPGVDPATWDEAMQACGTLAPGPAGP